MTYLLYRLHLLARQLLPLRPWCLGLAGLAAGIAGYALLGAGNSPPLMLRLGLVLALWLLLSYACIGLFQHLPPPVLPLDGWWQRICSRIRVLGYQLLALLMLLTGLLLLSLSLKLVFIR